MFEPIWNRNHIDHVQITVNEQLGVGHRGSFYDQTGALRDMVPNHLFQLLSLVAMEPPRRCGIRSGASIWPAGSAIARSRATGRSRTSQPAAPLKPTQR